MKTQPLIGSSESFSWQTRTRLSMPLRPSTDSIATSTRICAVIRIIAPLPARREASLPNPAQRNSSTECASCFQPRPRTRSHTPRPSPSPDAQKSVRRKPARLPSFALPKLRLAASSVPYSPAAKAEQPDADRVPAPVPRQPAKALQAAWFDAAEGFETDPIGVATERLPPEWVTHFCCSISADLSG